MTGSPLGAMLRELPRAHGGLTAALAAVVLAAGAIPAVLVLAVGGLADALLDVGTPARDAAVATAVVGVLFVVAQLLDPLATQLADALGRRLDRRLRDRVLNACLTPDGIGHLGDRDTLALVSGVAEAGVTKATARDALVAAVAVGTIRLQGVCCAVVLAGFHWWLGLGLLAAFAALTAGAVADYRAGARALGSAPTALRRANYLRGMALDPGNAKDLRLFGLACWVDQRFHREWLVVAAAPRGGRWWLVPVLGAGTLLAQLAVYCWLAAAVAGGSISTGEFVAYAGAVLGVVGILVASPDNLTIANGTVAVPLAARIEAAVLPARTGAGRPPPPLTDGIRLADVTFTYPGRDRPVFDRLTIDIPAGRSLAIVGLNGAGKSTLVNLLCGLYEPDSGHVLVDGVPLSTVDHSAWRRRIAVVFQDATRYELTPWEAIAFGAPDHAADHAGVVAAARQAGVDGVLGHRAIADEAGLSGGQWQRLALARAFFAVRHGANLLVLDEPTAALDVRAEAELSATLLAGPRELTTVLVSHRFATVRRADRIVVLRDGRVAEDGDHDTLVAAGGEYARLFRLQARSFLDGEEVGGREL
ncbi:MAG: ATP-binding cassette domain-containing protein [Actinophytocola sp.]|uniref:ABC transporter ATP-binding protein n=1 Tax=Actinophytocola sp. TaxID=1872138 RepID=UPI003C75F1E7